MTEQELRQILADHEKWLKGEGGKRANLERANLKWANLERANLAGANLYGANFYRANLYGVNLEEANLEGAYLKGAYLAGANLEGATLPDFQICPETGSFIGWKKLCNGSIAKLEIPAEAKRTSCLVSRKCRAEFVKVLEIKKGKRSYQTGSGLFKYYFLYVVGQTVYPDSYDDDIRVECTHGIHFFMTKEEAEDY